MLARACSTGWIDQGIIPVFNVFPFGADGNGSNGSDDTAAIQAAVDAASAAGGGIVYLPAGTFMISTAIWLKSNTWLRGAGVGVTTIKRKNSSIKNGDGANTGPVVNCGPAVGTQFSEASPGSGISISDITLDGNYSNQSVTTTTINPSGFRCLFVSDLTIDSVTIQNTLGTAYYIESPLRATISNVKANTVGQWSTVSSRNAFSLVNNTLSTTYGRNVSLYNFEFTTIGDTGILVSDMNDGVTVFNGSMDGGDFAFELVNNSAFNPVGNWLFSNVTAINILDYLITHTGSAAATYSNVLFSNCAFRGHATLHDGGAISFNGGVSNSISKYVFWGCIFDNINTKDTTTHHWVDMQPGSTSNYSNIKFVGCSFSGLTGSTRTTDTGFNLRGSMKSIIIDDCTLRDVPGIGIQFNDHTSYTATMRDIIVSNSIVENATAYGYRIRSLTATGTGTLQEIHFTNCIARDVNTQQVAAGFDIQNSQAGATIQNIFLRNCRVYKTAGSNLTYGLNVAQTAGVIDKIVAQGCDFSGTQTGPFNLSGTVTNVFLDGFINGVRSTAFTVTAAGVTTVSDTAVCSGMGVSLFPTNAAAGLLLQSKSCWVDTITTGSFKFNVSATGAGAPAGTETFCYTLR